MRTVNFRDGVLFPMADKLGIDRANGDLSPELVQGWIGSINDRVEEGWELLRLPELKATEERAFRTIWTADAQFRRVNDAGRPDEFLYLPNLTYYQVNPAATEDPPPGSIPPDWAAGGEELDTPEPPPPYFIAIPVLTDTYIDLDQRGRHPIGDVIGVYSADPKFQRCAWQPRYWRLSERGIEMRGCSGFFSAFVRYRIRPSKFTAEYWDGDLPYGKTALVYHRADGEVYRALKDNAGVIPTDKKTWVKVNMPAALAPFVVLAAAADACEDLQTAAKWEAQAYRALERKHTRLAEQGERTTYRRFSNFDSRISIGCSWQCSPCYFPQSLAEVTTLTDIWSLEDDFAEADHRVTSDGEDRVTTEGDLLLV